MGIFYTHYYTYYLATCSGKMEPCKGHPTTHGYLTIVSQKQSHNKNNLGNLIPH